MNEKSAWVIGSIHQRFSLALLVMGFLGILALPSLSLAGGIPEPGLPFPSLDNKLTANPEKECSRKDPCPFQEITVREALKRKKPIFISFSDPLHCVVCRGVLKVMGEVREKYGDRIVLIYINTRRDHELMKGMNLYGHPWNVYIDREGKVFRYFSGGISLKGASQVFDHLLK